MSTFASLVSVHLAGEDKDEISLDTLPGKFTGTRTDEALTPYGGLKWLVQVTNLERGDVMLEQVALLYAQRADTENVFDELKNQWGFRGDCSGKAVVTELAARLVLLTDNLWSLFTRLSPLTTE
jgi:hypothetical protein